MRVASLVYALFELVFVLSFVPWIVARKRAGLSLKNIRKNRLYSYNVSGPGCLVGLCGFLVSAVSLIGLPLLLILEEFKPHGPLARATPADKLLFIVGLGLAVWGLILFVKRNAEDVGSDYPG